MLGQFIVLVLLISFSPHDIVSALQFTSQESMCTRDGTKISPHVDALQLFRNTSQDLKRTEPSRRVIIKQVDYTTGGTEALVQLMLAFQDIGAPCFYTGGIAAQYMAEYRDLQARLLSVHDWNPDDIVIVPEVDNCIKLESGGWPYIWLLAKENFGPDACKRISHNHFLANLAGLREIETLTPYVTPSIVMHAKLTTGLQQNGSFEDLQSLLTLKEDLVLIDDDAGIPEEIPSHANDSKSDSRLNREIISELHVSHPKIHVVRTSSLEDKETAKMYLTRDPLGKIVTGLSRDDVNKLMVKAKVVVDLCMRGSERLLLEAALHGAVAITNFCDTGSDEIDVPLSHDHKINSRQELYHAVLKAIRDYPSEVMDKGQVALRKRYGSDIARASLATEAQQFLHSIAAGTAAQ
eukprot:gnl/TRDRNA2_/TRDRNA2_202563_c0_seq1.p1 gnl/TRDRNA2_/TRDRNA2_202563_c0~~gnl/TRDRNA2_/TRDRNA2_202563_c0_seq1.p1  ORF type:complete len:408 (-),score=46.05 gnl/TRDRNA2_/TRDRNA2_202563_c0_seq1:63-1286(-)